MKSYEKKLPSLTFIHHIRGSYQKDKKKRLEEWELRKDNTQIIKGGHRKKCSTCCQIGHDRNNGPDKHVDEQTATPAETAPNAQTVGNTNC